jgi:lipoyl(octanoyl) transferase
MIVRDLGLMPYRVAWAEQERVHAAVVDGAEEQLLLVEHPPVVTLGRRPEIIRNLIATAQQLAGRGVELVESDRGGDVTFHGPGQLVVYPIVRLIDHKLSVGGYVHRLEDAVITATNRLGIATHRDACAVGVWLNRPGQLAAKIAAIGVRVRKGATLHGLALNVSTDLSYFDLIVPCGLKNRTVTSVEKELGGPVEMERVKSLVVEAIADAIDAPNAAPYVRTASCET